VQTLKHRDSETLPVVCTQNFRKLSDTQVSTLLRSLIRRLVDLQPTFFWSVIYIYIYILLLIPVEPLGLNYVCGRVNPTLIVLSTGERIDQISQGTKYSLFPTPSSLPTN
jgi:hypothetical protein